MEPDGLREEAIRWLIDRSADGLDVLTRDDIADFRYEGERFPLVDRGRGIRVPANFDTALSVVTVFSAPGKVRPYEDQIGADGLIRYAYFQDDPDHRDNVGLRNAMLRGEPIVWLVGVAMSPARFQVVAPVYVVDEEVDRQRFVLLPAESDQVGRRDLRSSIAEEGLKSYRLSVVKQRMHQPLFRSSVLLAYENRCAICSLAHPRLLDAAHIVPDSSDQGIASVGNGMSMCKIHHAAFDSYFLGVRPDLTVEIREDLLEEVDGPMLKHGLQELHGQKLRKLPSVQTSQPRRDLLEIKYQMFRSATAADVA